MDKWFIMLMLTSNSLLAQIPDVSLDTEVPKGKDDSYNSFIINSSSSEFYPIQELNSLFSGEFANYHYQLSPVDSINYVLEHYEVENILYEFHWNMVTSSTVSSNMSSSEGVGDYFYDNWELDVMPIASLEHYKNLYPVFYNFPSYTIATPQETLAELAEVVSLCQQEGVRLEVVLPPLYEGFYDSIAPEVLAECYQSLGAITEFWDFSYSSLSTDPRYFYEDGSARNALGDMVTARLSGRSDLYLPSDFGKYVTASNLSEHISSLQSGTVAPLDNQAEIPILMYHHFSETNPDNVSEAKFREQLEALQEAGYETIDFQAVIDYVYYGKELPEKPIVITIDDGYSSNYEIAYPLLQEYGMKATIYTIGWAMGEDTYKNTGSPMAAHFSYEEALEMEQSGLVQIQSHTYDMHQWGPLEEGEARSNVGRFPEESVEDYIALLTEDYLRSKTEIEAHLETPVVSFAYPGGYSDDLSQYVLVQNGVQVTLSTQYNVSTVVKGLPQSLLSMNRYNVNDTYSREKLLFVLDPEQYPWDGMDITQEDDVWDNEVAYEPLPDAQSFEVE